MSVHPVVWSSPQPLWGRFGTLGETAFRADDQARPALLRFASDEFMDQLLALLVAEPRSLAATVARPETWRSPSAETPDLVERVPLPRIARALARMRAAEAPSTTVAATARETSAAENGVVRTLPLKLYHPAHQRHYLVAATLACAIPGFPDRAVAAGAGEQVGFVLRRLLPATETGAADPEPNAPLDEYAFVKDATGARWQRVSPVADAADPWAASVVGEEVLPLFALNFQDDVGHPRRMHAGVVPVGRREEYMTSRAHATASTSNGATTGTGAGTGASTRMSARKEQLRRDVVEPWKNLVRTAWAAVDRLMDARDGTPAEPPSLADRRRAAAAAANSQLQGASWLLLLDLADYLQHHVGPVWDAVVDPSRAADLDRAGQALFDWLNGTGAMSGTAWPLPTLPAGTPSPAAASNLRDALVKVRATGVRETLERATYSFPDPPEGSPPDNTRSWPGFGFLLAGVKEAGASYEVTGPHRSLSGAPPPSGSAQAAAEADAASLDRLVQLVIAAIDARAPAAAAPPLPFAARLRDALASTNGDAGWFAIRCVYVRGDCGPLHPPLLSAASQWFQLASFFDPDAPARPIRISLPLDTTPAGLRKYDKNAVLVISDVLCGQIQRAKGLGLGDLVRSVLPWPLHKDLDVGGMGPCAKSPELTFGMICSISIPIITICALILLLIIVSLLDFVFRWMPWFILCFPVPRLRAKP